MRGNAWSARALRGGAAALIALVGAALAGPAQAVEVSVTFRDLSVRVLGGWVNWGDLSQRGASLEAYAFDGHDVVDPMLSTGVGQAAFLQASTGSSAAQAQLTAGNFRRGVGPGGTLWASAQGARHEAGAYAELLNTTGMAIGDVSLLVSFVADIRVISAQPGETYDSWAEVSVSGIDSQIYLDDAIFATRTANGSTYQSQVLLRPVGGRTPSSLSIFDIVVDAGVTVGGAAAPVPEPSGAALAAAGGLVLAAVAQRRRRTNSSAARPAAISGAVGTSGTAST